MINLNNVNSKYNPLRSGSFLGKLIRFPLRFIAENSTLRILQGPARGLKWIVGSYNHGCWLGIYEYEKQKLVIKNVRENDVILELGGHVGYFTIIFSRLVGPNGVVHSYEPIPRNFNFIRKHLSLNKLNNVTVFENGVSNVSKTVRFQTDTHHAKSHVSVNGSLKVDLVDINKILHSKDSPKYNFIKVDIEGAENEIFDSIADYIDKFNTKAVISTHSDQITSKIVNISKEKGLKVTPHQWSNLPKIKHLCNATLLLIEK